MRHPFTPIRSRSGLSVDPRAPPWLNYQLVNPHSFESTQHFILPDDGFTAVHDRRYRYRCTFFCTCTCTCACSRGIHVVSQQASTTCRVVSCIPTAAHGSGRPTDRCTLGRSAPADASRRATSATNPPIACHLSQNCTFSPTMRPEPVSLIDYLVWGMFLFMSHLLADEALFPARPDDGQCEEPLCHWRNFSCRAERSSCNATSKE